MKKYLVTGGSGFIGSALVHKLHGQGHKVRVLDNNSRGNLRRLEGVIDQIEFIEGDIRDLEVVKSATKGVDSVIHLAYVNGTQFFYEHPELILDIGIRGMLNVIDACRAEGVKDLVLASSSEVYQTPPEIPTDESAPLSIPDILNPRYSYGGGKIACELMAINYGRKDFDRVCVFRPHNVYGPDMGWEHVLPQLIMRAQDLGKGSGHSKIDFPIQGDGEQTRSFIHIDDFTNGLVKVLEHGKHLEIYHIGTEEELKIKDVVHHLMNYLKFDYTLVPGESPKGATARRCPNINKLKSLGFSPEINFQMGIGSITDWYINNRDLAPQK